MCTWIQFNISKAIFNKKVKQLSSICNNSFTHILDNWILPWIAFYVNTSKSLMNKTNESWNQKAMQLWHWVDLNTWLAANLAAFCSLQRELANYDSN